VIQQIAETRSSIAIVQADRPITTESAATAKRLLACLTLAGPLFVIVALVQVLTRPGFDITRDAVSLLTLGSLGWIQSGSFILTGALSVAGAVGMHRALRDGTGKRWVPILLTVYGVGLVGGGIFHPDPSSGFPPGTPSSASAVSSWHGALHMIFGSLAFLSLIIICFVLASRFWQDRQRRRALCSLAAGGAGALGVMSGGAPHGTLTLFVGVGLAMIWMAAAAALLLIDRDDRAASAAS